MDAERKSASPVAIWAAMITVYIIWGSTYLAIRFAIETLPPFLMAAARFLVAGGLLYAWRRLAGDARPRGFEWRAAAVVGLFLLLGGNGGVVWAEQFVPSGVAALLVGTTPLWMVLLDALRGKRRPTPTLILGVLIGFAGIAVLVNPFQSTDRINIPGAIAVVLAALLWATGSLYSRNAPLPSSPLLGTSMEMLTGGLGLLVFGTLVGDWGRIDWAGISGRSLGGLFYLVIFGSLVAFTAYTWLLRNAPTPLVSTYAYVNPVVAILLGFIFFAEPLNGRVLVAAAIIVSAVVLITRAKDANLPAKEQVEEIPTPAD